MEEKLSAFLRNQMSAATDLAIRGLQRRPGGASRESWAFDVVWRENGTELRRSCILRRDPTGSVMEGHQTNRSFEFRILKALESTSVPAPKAYWLDDAGKWLERPALIMERVSGQPTPVGTFPAGESEELRAKIGAQFVPILAELHRTDWRALGLDFLGASRVGVESAARQVDLWEMAYRKDRLEVHPILDETFGWLRRNLPATDRIVLVHGDYRSGNYLYDETGRITAMLDWETAHLGDPMEDLGWASMKFWNGGGLAVGLMPRAELLRRYEKESGKPVDEKRVFFYEVLGNAKMATIALTGTRAFCQGTTAHMIHGILGLLVPRLLEDLVDQLRL
jgi:aminoglycoside phosphotransferase (APT) family kinase protein